MLSSRAVVLVQCGSCQEELEAAEHLQWFHRAAVVLYDIPSAKFDCLLPTEYSAGAERRFRDLTTEADESRRGGKRLR